MATTGPDEPGQDASTSAARAMVSLSQAILAPLDAIAKAQVHAARSFLNFVLQIGFPHRDGDPADAPASFDQVFQVERIGPDGLPQKLTLAVPTLALVPIQPLGIDSACYDLELVVQEVGRHQQMQSSRAQQGAPDREQKRPWYLVPEPISVRGTLSHPGGGKDVQQQSTIKVHVAVSRSPTPAGLSKLLSAMTQMAGIDGHLDTNSAPPSPPDSGS